MSSLMPELAFDNDGTDIEIFQIGTPPRSCLSQRVYDLELDYQKYDLFLPTNEERSKTLVQRSASACKFCGSPQRDKPTMVDSSTNTEPTDIPLVGNGNEIICRNWSMSRRPSSQSVQSSKSMDFCIRKLNSQRLEIKPLVGQVAQQYHRQLNEVLLPPVKSQKTFYIRIDPDKPTLLGLQNENCSLGNITTRSTISSVSSKQPVMEPKTPQNLTAQTARFPNQSFTPLVSYVSLYDGKTVSVTQDPHRKPHIISTQPMFNV